MDYKRRDRFSLNQEANRKGEEMEGKSREKRDGNGREELERRLDVGNVRIDVLVVACLINGITYAEYTIYSHPFMLSNHLFFFLFTCPSMAYIPKPKINQPQNAS